MKSMKLFFLSFIFIFPNSFCQELIFEKNVEIKNQNSEIICTAEKFINQDKTAPELEKHLIKLSSVVNFGDEKVVSQVEYVNYLSCYTFEIKKKKYHFITGTYYYIDGSSIVIVADEKLNYVTTLKNNERFQLDFLSFVRNSASEIDIDMVKTFPWYEYMLGMAIQDIKYLKDKNTMEIHTRDWYRVKNGGNRYIFTYSVVDNFKLLHMEYK